VTQTAGSLPRITAGKDAISNAERPAGADTGRQRPARLRVAADVHRITPATITHSANSVNLFCSAAAQAGFDSHAWQLPLVILPYLSRNGRWLDWVTLLRAGLSAAHRLRDDRAQAWVHRRLGQADAFIGNYEEATESMRAALRTFCRLGDRTSLACKYVAAASIRERQECFRESLSLARRALVLFRDRGHQFGEASCG
jgi:cell division inhibitor SulA